MIAVIFGAFGLIVGSFLNVVIIRNGVRSLDGRSACVSCGKQILWYDLVPVVSWIFLRGQCRFCGAKISWQYPLVELLTAVFFAAIGLAPISLVARLAGLPIIAILIAISVYDLRHAIIPDAWVWAFNLLALLFSLLSPFYFLLTTNYVLLTILSGPLAALPLFLLWLASRGRWMGFGDVKLALGIGWLLGPLYGIEAVFLAFIYGAAVSVPLLFFSSKMWGQVTGKSAGGYTMKSEVPFGPFLVASCVTLWLLILYGNDPLSLFQFTLRTVV